MSNRTMTLELCAKQECLDNFISSGLITTLPIVQRTAKCENCDDPIAFRIVFDITQPTHYDWCATRDKLNACACNCDTVWMTLNHHKIILGDK